MHVLLSILSLQLVVKTGHDGLPPTKGGMVDIANPACHSAIVFAVHKTSSCPKILSAVLASKEALHEVQNHWNVVDKIRKFEKSLKLNETVYFCVPLSESNDDDHLFLKDRALR